MSNGWVVSACALAGAYLFGVVVVSWWPLVIVGAVVALVAVVTSDRVFNRVETAYHNRVARDAVEAGRDPMASLAAHDYVGTLSFSEMMTLVRWSKAHPHPTWEEREAAPDVVKGFWRAGGEPPRDVIL